MDSSGNFRSHNEAASCHDKLENEDPAQEEHASLNKRLKLSSDILNEPSPLGLRLRKSPSLLDLIQMKLSQGSMCLANTHNESLSSRVKKESRGAAASGSVDKLKASNFTASLLRIGSWEFKSRYEGDLVAKFYYAKQKLVWEFLGCELKSKIEIQWSDIVTLKANCPDIGPSSLTAVLARQPLFFREFNPQPRRHTVWQATSDFTDGHASKYRQHFLQCRQGLLTKHFEKLMQCNTHLNFLSQRPQMILNSPPRFDTQPAAFENSDNPKYHDLHQVNGKGSATSCFQDIGSLHSSLSPSFKIENNDPPGITLDCLPLEAPSPSSGNSNSETDSKGPRDWDQIKLPGLRPSMSASDFINQVERCLSEEMTPFSGGGPEYKEMLDDIAQYLLSDNQVTASDEESLMSRVNSLRCLLQKDPAAVLNSHEESAVEGPDNGKNIQLSHDLELMQDNKIKIDVKTAQNDSRRFLW
ncbi:uncharacterized protein LOC133293038 [Gastrolobium bilobum]|uniref:uncharacterized protein LOC133293038 n=1 Tax=Gastrolobium bilobum TaxID=150636 RepID=UPI002AB06BE9|nr:uncharacterized protein LOC133293038 [Gastrolobium bilobum]